ncbi:hypothetical protein NDU88_003945 [Pleurodeles waltl]|uniref:Uncharacterized protein n=1 Tax=Pleurodeles waltl TaxID=8319 RepID=A0AAV7T6M6_PLEWA|nr:hypothetical protein NDU88_003945 [Pleurodeles waltl]
MPLAGLRLGTRPSMSHACPMQQDSSSADKRLRAQEIASGWPAGLLDNVVDVCGPPRADQVSLSVIDGLQLGGSIRAVDTMSGNAPQYVD